MSPSRQASQFTYLYLLSQSLDTVAYIQREKIRTTSYKALQVESAPNAKIPRNFNKNATDEDLAVRKLRPKSDRFSFGLPVGQIYNRPIHSFSNANRTRLMACLAQ